MGEEPIVSQAYSASFLIGKKILIGIKPFSKYQIYHIFSETSLLRCL